jgi:hypothetical protein
MHGLRRRLSLERPSTREHLVETRYTSPIPPAPSGPSTSYGPSRVPICRAMCDANYTRGVQRDVGLLEGLACRRSQCSGHGFRPGCGVGWPRRPTVEFDDFDLVRAPFCGCACDRSRVVEGRAQGGGDGWQLTNRRSWRYRPIKR